MLSRSQTDDGGSADVRSRVSFVVIYRRTASGQTADRPGGGGEAHAHKTGKWVKVGKWCGAAAGS